MVRIIAVLLVIPLNIFSNDFEGSFQIIKTSHYDTSYIFYYVKENRIRIEEHSKDAQILNSFIVDLDKDLVYAIDPSNKQFKQIIIKPYISTNDKNIEIIKSENFKYINGYKCIQWRVKNNSRNTEIAYWVAKDDFSFFSRMLELINRSDKTSVYFLHIPDNQGYMPMMAVERTILRKEKSRFEIKYINREVLNTNLFTVPGNYKQIN